MGALFFSKEAEEYVKHSVKLLKHFIDYTGDLDNAYVPDTSAFLGIGAHSTYFSDADIIFGQDTSWVHSVIHKW